MIFSEHPDYYRYRIPMFQLECWTEESFSISITSAYPYPFTGMSKYLKKTYYIENMGNVIAAVPPASSDTLIFRCFQEMLIYVKISICFRFVKCIITFIEFRLIYPSNCSVTYIHEGKLNNTINSHVCLL